ncbi:AAA family ATPase [Brachyspira murdochii]|uniref:AAA family ATPase n=1 Tax=Brachyspira murdochii TaxID=84378 RepID=UPI0030073EB4
MYNVGMYAGSFNPIHLGHVRCIIEAANQCKTLFIILCVGNNRNEIDRKIRYRWLYQLTKHIGNVKIIFIEDNAKTKEDYTEDLWEEDSIKIKNAIGEKIDAVFLGDDYKNKDSFYTRYYKESKLVFIDRDEISSTKIRENVYKYWDYLPNIVKPYYTKKVLLLGSESTGKSTLTINLANYYNTNYIEEAGRELSEKSGTDLLMLSEDFTEILLTHKLNEIKALEYSNKILFIDTDAVITNFYMHFLKDENIVNNEILAKAIININKYDAVLFLEPDVDFVQDGDRSEIIKNNREKYSSQIKDILDSFNIRYHSINGDYQSRFKKAVSIIDALLKNE